MDLNQESPLRQKQISIKNQKPTEFVIQREKTTQIDKIKAATIPIIADRNSRPIN